MTENIHKPRIFTTGDCHGIFTNSDFYGKQNRFSTRVFKEQKNLSRDDYVIVCGDFGYWDNSPQQIYDRKWLSKKPFTILFVDGNHENFDMLNALPVEMWHGGKVHKISENIIHLMRGQVFDIGGKKWFTMGGAPSHDIEDGILDINNPGDLAKLRQFNRKKARLWKEGIYWEPRFRIKGVSWWPEEMISEEEKAEGIKNLEAVDYKVDYVVTHEVPWDIMNYLGNGHYEHNDVSDWLQKNILEKTEYTHWFAGHHHVEMNFPNARLTIQFESVTELHY